MRVWFSSISSAALGCKKVFHNTKYRY